MSDESRTTGAPSFDVGFDSATNNLKLAGSGSVSVAAASVALEGAGMFRLSGRRVELATADIVDVEHRESGNIVRLHTRADRRWVSLAMRSAEDAHALLALLPQEVTPEFHQRQTIERRFHEHLGGIGAKAPVTVAIVALNIAVFVVMLFAGAGFLQTDASVHVRFGSNFGPLTWSGQPWRLITSAFIHFGVLHLAFNMYALYRGGMLTERLFGSTRFALIYLLAALSGSVVSGWWQTMRNSAGASGAIFGVYGALLVFFALRRAEIPRDLLNSTGRGALTLCVYTLVLGATNPLVDNACHVGGLLGGAVAACFLVRPVDPAARATPQPRRLAAVAFGICAALFALAAPLALPGGSRAALLRLDAAQERFGVEEARLVTLHQQILQAQGAHKLSSSGAAARLEREVLTPWRQAMRILLEIPPIEPPTSLAARRRELLRAYVLARERAMELSIEDLRHRDAGSSASSAAAWQAVSELVDRIHELSPSE